MFKLTLSHGVHFDYSWSLKDNKPKLQEAIVKLSASGEELSHIYNYFRGIPSRMQRNEVVWTGVYAQFIYDNI